MQDSPPWFRRVGKSTIIKQMKIIHQGGFTADQLLECCPIVYRNVVECARSVVIYMRKIGVECHETTNRHLVEKILDYDPETYGGSQVYFSPEIAEAIHQFLRDPVVEDHMNEFYLMDSAEYFHNNVLRIGALLLVT